jgi:general secretion pathway protein E/type IV pilus assembly protein PilB
MNLRKLIAEHFGAEEVDLGNVRFTSELLGSVPANVARRYRVIPVSDSPNVLRLAIADPADLDTLDSLSHLLRRDLELRIAEERQLDEFIERLYKPEGRA